MASPVVGMGGSAGGVESSCRMMAAASRSTRARYWSRWCRVGGPPDRPRGIGPSAFLGDVAREALVLEGDHDIAVQDPRQVRHPGPRQGGLRPFLASRLQGQADDQFRDAVAVDERPRASASAPMPGRAGSSSAGARQAPGVGDGEADAPLAEVDAQGGAHVAARSSRAMRSAPAVDGDLDPRRRSGWCRPSRARDWRSAVPYPSSTACASLEWQAQDLGLDRGRIQDRATWRAVTVTGKVTSPHRPRRDDADLARPLDEVVAGLDAACQPRLGDVLDRRGVDGVTVPAAVAPRSNVSTSCPTRVVGSSLQVGRRARRSRGRPWPRYRRGRVVEGLVEAPSQARPPGRRRPRPRPPG